MRLGEFGPPRIRGRTLVILCAYRGGVNQRGPWRCPSIGGRASSRFAAAVNLLALYPLRSHIARMRDHYANPRALGVQLDLAKQALDAGAPTSVRVVLDELLAANAPTPLPIDPYPQVLALSYQTPVLNELDTVLLVYADPLGLGFGGLERRIVSLGVRDIVVVNGRRRLFPLSPRARRALRWRRLLAETRLPELAAAFVVVPLAALLATLDRLRTAP